MNRLHPNRNDKASSRIHEAWHGPLALAERSSSGATPAAKWPGGTSLSSRPRYSF